MERTFTIVVMITAMLSSVCLTGTATAQETTGQPEEMSLPDFIEIGGLVELSASHERSSEGERSTSTAAEQLELGIGIEPHDWFGSELIWLLEHEEEVDGGNNLGIVMATIVVGPPGGSWWLKGGIQFLPFTLFELAEVHAAHKTSVGPFQTGAIADPLSFEYGSKREKSLLLGGSLGPFLGNVYGYYGEDERSHDPRTGFGATLGYKKNLNEDNELAFNLSIIDDLGTLDIFQAGLYEQHESPVEAGHGSPTIDEGEEVPGWAIATQLGLGNVSVTGEYMIALDRFGQDLLAYNGQGARPSAWAFETSYGFALAGSSGDVTLGYHGTAEAVGLELPASRYVAVLRVDLWKELLFGTFEWVHNRDYGTANDGTGERVDTYTVQLGVEF